MSTADTIYLLSGDTKLQRIPRQHYESEDFLQTLIQKYPEVLAGDQMADEEVRFLVVRREAGIPDSEGVGDRWSVDHLLIDHNGVPTLVECKRSSDPRIRREVVGQLLEYAANADVYWPAERIRAWAMDQFGGSDGADKAILGLLHLEAEDEAAEHVEAFWAQLEANVRNGKVRLLFVADELPREVRRVIEFLNLKMSDVEVLGVELRQYAGEGLRALVPRIVGQTEAARRRKTTTATTAHTSQEEMIAACPPEIQPALRAMVEEAERRGLLVYWGQKGLSLRVTGQPGGPQSLFYCFPPGAVGSPTAFVEGYLPAALRGTRLGEEYSRGLLSIGLKKGGQYTYRLPVTAETVGSLGRALDLVWETARRMGEDTVSS
jgi:hypothetical protein